MRLLKTLFVITFLFAATLAAGAQTISVDHFNKVIISPYIKVVFEQGETESVTVNRLLVDSSKLHIEVHGGTLRIYLEGAKDIPYNDKSYNNKGLYPNHAVVATVTYRALKTLSLRGAETHLCQSPLTANKFALRVYGASTVVFTEMRVRKLRAVIYGESTLEIQSGKADEQHFTCYGEGRINTTAITGRTGKITSFGEAEFSMNVSDRIKITAFGDAKLRYMGNPDIIKGVHIGDVDVLKID
ncbi:head GIN domain-containing protein [Flavitalea sp. BT771]|uniref:head GIN domain-containing protein n=1 Tax=Flavitalea sp. BT771 TaxID=3063329 RepID=UPI0026E180E7|nr:head GIN domain-containing protein [Flavitalea sp. BT771]MDO6431961.1 head GIN domain-containing protein [Flavitalea sp. BT771]MDV6220870.1 head GIN domain-containing protein [Flavitalea sp. BT771]